MRLFIIGKSESYMHVLYIYMFRQTKELIQYIQTDYDTYPVPSDRLWNLSDTNKYTSKSLGYIVKFQITHHVTRACEQWVLWDSCAESRKKLVTKGLADKNVPSILNLCLQLCLQITVFKGI